MTNKQEPRGTKQKAKKYVCLPALNSFSESPFLLGATAHQKTPKGTPPRAASGLVFRTVSDFKPTFYSAIPKTASVLRGKQAAAFLSRPVEEVPTTSELYFLALGSST